METVARIRNDLKEKFGVPRQSGLAEHIVSRVVFEPGFRDPEWIRGIEGFSHLWLLWEFSEVKNHDRSPTVRPPRLGGNERMGVFATRSPYRPNNIGLSSVRLIAVEDGAEGGILVVSGADLMDGTPIIDIKPYIPFTDSHPDAVSGFVDSRPYETLDVEIPAGAEASVPEAAREGLRELLSLDPRPAYQDDPERTYGIAYADLDVRFRVEGRTLTVTEIVRRRLSGSGGDQM
ncbi:MAG: tRNA (N6-threonylcarbamoyladenosine(37)-N6)-methyltransferase TrmO [Clostridia bacterium]|nr:tRNA (N6-threonylcarbamoyladenosine(37)-N6)-methyltransferase TrmO [Clostridia bacterium]